jgi:hypothetical protein
MDFSEADMSQNIGHRGHPIGEAIWIVAGIVVLMAFGDELVMLALGLAIAAMATAWWIHHRVGRQAQAADAELAPVTHLPQRHVIKASGHTSSRRPSAA